MKSFTHHDHLIIVVLAYVLIGLFAAITVSVSFLNPIAQAYKNFSLSDMYYQIERYAGQPDTSELITIVDMTDVYERKELAELFCQLNEMGPIALGIDIIFEGLKDDNEGNTALVKAVNNIRNKGIFANKLTAYDSNKNCFNGATRSFFCESLSVRQGYANLTGNMEMRTIRNYTYQQNLCDSIVFSFPYMLAKTVDKNTGNNKEMTYIDYGNYAFRVLKANQIDKNEELINNHIVLVGTMEEEQDMHLSSVGKMSGLEIQAHSLQTILARKHISDAPTWINYLLATVFCLLFELCLYATDLFTKQKEKNVLVVFLNKSSLISTTIVSLWFILINWIGYIVFKHTNIYIDSVLCLAVAAMTLVARKYYGAGIKALNVKYNTRWIKNSIFNK